jgi:hypothetical protein
MIRFSSMSAKSQVIADLWRAFSSLGRFRPARWRGFRRCHRRMNHSSTASNRLRSSPTNRIYGLSVWHWRVFRWNSIPHFRRYAGTRCVVFRSPRSIAAILRHSICRFAGAMVNKTYRTNHKNRYLRGAHLHREHGDGQAFVQCDVLGNIDRLSGFTHGRTGCEYDHVTGLEARSHAIQVVKSRGHDCDVDRVVSHFLQAV